MNARQIKALARDYIEVGKSALGEEYEDEDGNRCRSTYLGSLINPSGKFYTPFANSNVDNCPYSIFDSEGSCVSRATLII